jgi:hypothetical protein
MRKCLECAIEFEDSIPMMKIDMPPGWLCKHDFLASLQRKYNDFPLFMRRAKVEPSLAQQAIFGAAEKTWDIKLKEQGFFKKYD